jgi:3-isopropylmalate/(R)-2-methylmalate dehydratase small subunit
LPFLESAEVDGIQEDDLLEIDLSNGIIKNLTQDKSYSAQAFPEFLQEIITAGGLMPWVTKNKN